MYLYLGSLHLCACSVVPPHSDVLKKISDNEECYFHAELDRKVLTRGQIMWGVQSGCGAL